MRQKLMWTALTTAALVILSLHRAGSSSTRSVDLRFTSTTLAVGRFGQIDTHAPNVELIRSEADPWESWLKTHGPSDLYVQSNVWQPGGSTGWHTHPGQSLIVVTAGTLTEYDGHDSKCKASLHTEGAGFVDRGDHVHILRNEGSVEARTIAVQLVPADAMQRIDAQDPQNCHFQMKRE